MTLPIPIVVNSFSTFYNNRLRCFLLSRGRDCVSFKAMENRSGTKEERKDNANTE